MNENLKSSDNRLPLAVRTYCDQFQRSRADEQLEGRCDVAATMSRSTRVVDTFLSFAPEKRRWNRVEKLTRANVGSFLLQISR